MMAVRTSASWRVAHAVMVLFKASAAKHANPIWKNQVCAIHLLVRSSLHRMGPGQQFLFVVMATEWVSKNVMMVMETITIPAIDSVCLRLVAAVMALLSAITTKNVSHLAMPLSLVDLIVDTFLKKKHLHSQIPALVWNVSMGVRQFANSRVSPAFLICRIRSALRVKRFSLSRRKHPKFLLHVQVRNV